MAHNCQDVFTLEEAVGLLEHSWKVQNVLKRLKEDRKNLVDELVTLILAKVPFQSITMLAVTPEERRRPTLDEIKKKSQASIGGLCYEINTFTCSLLKALGFNVWRIRATVTSTVTSPDNHTVILINSLVTEGDLYLIDCGTGFPIFRAVCLDFAEESPVYHDGFLEYKYVRHEGKILRMHGKGDMIKPNNPPIEGLDFFLGRWRRFYYFTPDTKAGEVPGDEEYRCTTSLTPFTSSPRAVWFPRKRLVAIANNKLIVESESGELVTKILKDDDEILNAYQEHFPQLKQDDVRRALAVWRRFSKA